MLCPARIEFKQPSRPHAGGRAHDRCIKAEERLAAAASKPVPRSKRPYDSLGPTQRWKRRKQALADITNTLQQTGCPIDALQLQPRATPAELLHLSTAERERIRSVASLRATQTELCPATVVQARAWVPRERRENERMVFACASS
jgi:hypothetical protein